MMGQATKAREAKAISYIGAINRAQQAYRLENSSFATDIDALNVNLPNSGDQYTYSPGTIGSSAAEYQASPDNSDLRAFTGCVKASAAGALATTSVEILEAPAGGSVPATPPTCPP
jgi:type IV pilus assembly protein PilA